MHTTFLFIKVFLTIAPATVKKGGVLASGLPSPWGKKIAAFSLLFVQTVPKDQPLSLDISTTSQVPGLMWLPGMMVTV